MYAYCGNNPIMYSDPTGNIPVLTLTILYSIVILPVVLMVDFVFNDVGEEHQIDVALMDTSDDLNTKHDDKILFLNGGLSEQNRGADISIGFIEAVNHVTDFLDIKWGLAKASGEIGLSLSDTFGAGANFSGLYGGVELKIPIFNKEIILGGELSLASYGVSASIGAKTGFSIACFFGVSGYIEIQ